MNRLSTQLLTGAAGLAALAAVACSSHQTLGEQVDDAWITTRVETKLAADPEVNPFRIDVDTDAGVVTLRGEVKKDVARNEAGKHAANTKGVREVRNLIEVSPDEKAGDNLLTDTAITAKIKAKLAADPQLNPFNIDVDTRDGEVTLSGRVGSDDRRREAVDLATRTKGVVRVIDELKVAKTS